MSTVFDHQGNILATGFFYGTLKAGTKSFTAPAGQASDLVVKLTPSGSVTWAVAAGNVQSTWGNAVATAGQGDVYVAGAYKGTVTFGGAKLTASGGQDAYVAKLNASGKYVWAESAGGPLLDSAVSVAVDAAGSARVAGYFSGTAAFGSFKATTQGDRDVYVARLDPAGKFKWVFTGGGAALDVAEEVALDGAGNAWVTGYYTGAVVFGSRAYATKAKNDVFVLRLNPAGKSQWSTSSVGTTSGAGNLGRCLAVSSKGAVFLGGHFQGTVWFGPHKFTAQGSLLTYEDIFIWGIE